MTYFKLATPDALFPYDRKFLSDVLSKAALPDSPRTEALSCFLDRLAMLSRGRHDGTPMENKKNKKV